MELNSITLQSIQNAKQAEDSNALLEIIDAFFGEAIPDNLLDAVCSFLEIQDKAVNNNTAQLLSYNPNEKISEKLAVLISSPDIKLRNLAGEILIKRQSNSVLPLLSILPNTNDDDRKFIIDILGLIDDSRSIKPIEDVLINEKNENVILACIEALGNLHSEDSLQLIIECFEKNDLYRPTIIEAVGKIGSAKGLSFLQKVYEQEDELVKYSIVESLGKIGNEETFFFLLNELNKTNGPLVYPIINSIDILKRNFNFDIPFDERTKNLLLETVFEGEEEFKTAAAHLLLDYDDKEIIASLLRIYGNNFEIDELLKEKFFLNLDIVLANIPKVLDECPYNGQSMLLLLKEILEVNSGLTDIEKRNLISSVSNKLSSADEEIRRNAMELLFMFDQESALLFMDLMIEDNSIWNKLRLIELLEGINNPAAKEALEKLSADEEEMVQASAKSVLQNRLSTTEN